MEIRDWAIRILSADTLAEKLFYPDVLTDKDPGGPLFWDVPTRPQGMQFQRHSSKDRLPRFDEHAHLEKRAICLHRFAGHELLAVEIMAYAILAFPQASKSFRKGVAHTLKEEQTHVQLYITRLEEMGVKFGDLPLYKHFWSHVPYLTDPIKYLSLMSLTFEMANLDFAPQYGASFAKHGDILSKQLMDTILNDEIRHVSFGFRWINKLNPSKENPLSIWRESLPPLVTPKRAKGFIFNEENRRQAGIPSDWIDLLKHS
ncbi:MAG: DUF455 family protein [Rhabdochlamydiaceae bacterium]